MNGSFSNKLEFSLQILVYLQSLGFGSWTLMSSFSFTSNVGVFRKLRQTLRLASAGFVNVLQILSIRRGLVPKGKATKFLVQSYRPASLLSR